MTTGAAQLGFAAEFALFLAVGATIAVVAPGVPHGVEDRRTRALLVAGLAAVAVAAFLAGAQLVDDPADIAVLAPRLAGLLVATAGAWAVPDGHARLLLVGGAVVVALAQALHAADATTGAHVSQLVGAAAISASAIRLSRKSIPARITAAAAATILLVVLAVAVATSAVLTDNVSDEALNRTEVRAASEAAQTEVASTDATVSARIVASSLPAERSQELAILADSPDSPAGQTAATRIRDDLARLSDFLFAQGPLLFLTDDGRVVAAVGELDDATVVDFAGSTLVAEVIERQEPARAAIPAGGSLFAAGAHPVSVAGAEGARLVGLVVASDRLDDGYLESRRVDLASEGLAIVDRRGVIATDGPLPPSDVILRVGSEALDRGGTIRDETAGYFVVGEAIMDPDGAPAAAAVAALPTRAVDATRESLLRALFLAALLAVLVAVILAALVGRRIGSGVRRLTVAVEGMEAGDLDARADVASEDEVGVLAGAFNSMAGSIRTMTDDLRQAAIDEARLRGRLEAVVEGMGEGLIAVDDRGCITDLNAAAEETTGLEVGEVVGEEAQRVVRLLDANGIDVSGRLVAPAGSWSVDGSIVRGDGEEVPVLVSAGDVVGEDGEVVGATFVVRDVRREREIEQMKTDFLSNISHELRTPLTPIKGYASLMKNRDLSKPRVRELGAAMVQSSRQLERIIDQLVSFATIAAGRLGLRVEALDLRTELDAAIERWGARLPDQHELRRRVARHTGKVLADPRYLAQSLDELIDNAVKFSPEGGRIWLRGEPSLNGDRPMVVVSVVDQGVGIPRNRLNDLVGDFSQGDPSATRQFGGLGLGLAMVDRIVRAHEGHLDVESRPGKGSTFAMVLPMEEKGDRRRVPRQSGSNARRRTKRQGSPARPPGKPRARRGKPKR